MPWPGRRAPDRDLLGSLTLADLVGYLQRIRGRRPRRPRPVGDGRRATIRAAGGTELDSLRPFQPGDDSRRVDWRLSFVRSELITRVYEPHRRLPLHIVLDRTRSMAHPAGDPARRPSGYWLASQIALGAAYATLFRRDPVTIALPTAGAGAPHVMTLRSEDQLVGLARVLAERAPAARRGQSSFERFADAAARTPARKGVTLLVSDFLVPPDSPDLAALRRLVQRGRPVVTVLIDAHRWELDRLRASGGRGARLLDSERREVHSAAIGAEVEQLLTAAVREHRESVRGQIESPTARVVPLELGEDWSPRDFLTWLAETFDDVGLI